MINVKDYFDMRNDPDKQALLLDYLEKCITTSDNSVAVNYNPNTEFHPLTIDIVEYGASFLRRSLYYRLNRPSWFSPPTIELTMFEKGDITLNTTMILSRNNRSRVNKLFSLVEETLRKDDPTTTTINKITTDWIKKVDKK